MKDTDRMEWRVNGWDSNDFTVMCPEEDGHIIYRGIIRDVSQSKSLVVVILDHYNIIKVSGKLRPRYETGTGVQAVDGPPPWVKEVKWKE